MSLHMHVYVRVYVNVNKVKLLEKGEVVEVLIKIFEKKKKDEKCDRFRRRTLDTYRLIALRSTKSIHK